VACGILEDHLRPEVLSSGNQIERHLPPRAQPRRRRRL